MNKLNLDYPGKTQFYIEDIDFLQTAYTDAFKNLAAAFGSGNGILHGCALQPDGVTVTPGAVLINGEIFAFAGATLTQSGAWYFVPNTAYDTTGDRIFIDGTINGTVRQTYQLRNAVLELYTSPPVDAVPLGVTPLHNHDAKYYTKQNADSLFALKTVKNLRSGSEVFSDNSDESATITIAPASYFTTLRIGSLTVTEFYIEFSLATSGGLTRNGFEIGFGDVFLFPNGKPIQATLIETAGNSAIWYNATSQTPVRGAFSANGREFANGTYKIFGSYSNIV